MYFYKTFVSGIWILSPVKNNWRVSNLRNIHCLIDNFRCGKQLAFHQVENLIGASKAPYIDILDISRKKYTNNKK